ncbi:MAG: hypothetical protein JJU37_07265 [Balneolaceae bacterium]|nr:hypothetical protein [Balneolaceae bacterium]
MKSNLRNEMINRFLKPTNGIISVILISVLILIQGCGVTDSDDPNDFVVPFEMLVPVTAAGPGKYNISSGRLSAKFPDREDAISYSLRVINEDGTVNAPITRAKHLLPLSEGMREYGVVVGTPTFVFDVDQSAKDHVVNEFMKELEEWSHIYHKLQVTVNF